MKQSAIYAIIRGIIERGGKERLIRRLERNTKWEGDCVIWIGTKGSKNGYGRINFKYGGKHVQFSAHAVFMTLMTCRPIPSDKEIDHTCNNRDCVRHLQLVTRQENLGLRDARRNQKNNAG